MKSIGLISSLCALLNCNLRGRTREMAHWVKYLPHNPETLSSNPKKPFQTQMQQHMSVIPIARGERAGLVYVAAKNNSPVTTKVAYEDQHSRQSTDLHTHEHTCTHTNYIHTQDKRFKNKNEFTNKNSYLLKLDNLNFDFPPSIKC